MTNAFTHFIYHFSCQKTHRIPSLKPGGASSRHSCFLRQIHVQKEGREDSECSTLQHGTTWEPRMVDLAKFGTGNPAIALSLLQSFLGYVAHTTSPRPFFLLGIRMELNERNPCPYKTTDSSLATSHH